ncbi:sigma 54 modulation/S30EA ribosomal C-terminal domain-containing protein [Pseudonocardia acaciae]|uniref:sigma 54 modulation/S30EA ribosomal C-terminal domain-containing protein n=1 Tax=Pseudonocardia acaciae TaxID=551276 RepID=UPI001FE1D4EA|nr:sigma 54 modulation/S30EA ribosomal C-terminal domain-containing protein [Pseudonocardia acaciae]
MDLLHDRLRERLRHDHARARGNWEQRRARRTSNRKGEWRHDDPPADRPRHFPRPPEQRQIVRHKSVTLARCGADDAAEHMRALDFDFHLFTEAGSGQDSVLPRRRARPRRRPLPALRRALRPDHSGRLVTSPASAASAPPWSSRNGG